MNVPLLRCNWSATSVIGCGGCDWSLIGRGSVWLAATAHYPSVCTSSDLILTSQIYQEGGGCSANHNKLCKRGLQLTIRTWRYCSGPARLILTQACLDPVLFSYSSSTRLPDLTSLRWRLMTPPWLTAAGIEGQRRSFIIRWQVPFSPAAGPATNHMPFIFCFVVLPTPLALLPQCKLNSRP